MIYKFFGETVIEVNRKPSPGHVRMILLFTKGFGVRSFKNFEKI